MVTSKRSPGRPTSPPPRQSTFRLSEQPVHLVRGQQEAHGSPRDGPETEQRVPHGKQAIAHVRQTVQFCTQSH